MRSVDGTMKILGVRLPQVPSVATAAAVLGLMPLPATAQKKGAEVLSSMNPIHPPSPALATRNLNQASDAPIQIRIGPYFGWEHAFTISNGRVEALVVPDIGRVMQFRFVDQASPFWEDTAMRGRKPDPSATEWGNFGGDKTWPAPQSEWGQVTPRAWPPPVAFDSMAVDMFVRRDALVLRSPVDPHYGIRTERILSLPHEAPVMTITTRYDKVEGPPVQVGVWVITQLEDPVRVFAALPAASIFPEGYDRQSGDLLPANLRREDGLLSLTRDSEKATKIGTDASRLLWVGETQMLLIESQRVRGAAYPDHQSSAEIYTNPNPKPYVELEMLGPMTAMKPGDQISQTSTYTLIPRKTSDPDTDALRVLRGLPINPR